MTTLCTDNQQLNSEYAEPKSLCAEQIMAARRLPGVINWLGTPLRRLQRRYAQKIERQAFDNLLRLDEHMLKDIGVTRQDVKWASQLPLSEDAATQLEIIARRR